jgi:hypothetical protein
MVFKLLYLLRGTIGTYAVQIEAVPGFGWAANKIQAI